MMQRDPSPISYPNTFRDSNDIPSSSSTTATNTTGATKDFILPSAPPSEQMDYHYEPPRQSIIRSVEPDYLPSSRFIPPNQQNITHRPLVRSIVRPSDNNDDDDVIFQENHEQLHNSTLINDHNNPILGATGYDSTKLSELESDEAYALRLQQEEYSKGSIIPNQRVYNRFQAESDDESTNTIHPIRFHSNIPQFSNDEEFAAYLQAQENQNRPRHFHAPPFFSTRQRSNPTSSQTSETDETEIEHVLPFPGFPQPPIPTNITGDSDDENPYRSMPHPFFQIFAHQGQPLPDALRSMLMGYRGHGHRRTGNLQDTEEDFGPEDYERLLQLDDTIRKKKLTKDQINSIPLEKFFKKSDNNEEENKCGVCLEHFEINQTMRRFPCRHVYHKDCADRWLQESNVCPICREPPVKVSSNVRHPRQPHNHRRPPPSTSSSSSNRNPTNRNNTNNNNNNNNSSQQHRRGPHAPQRQS